MGVRGVLQAQQLKGLSSHAVMNREHAVFEPKACCGQIKGHACLYIKVHAVMDGYGMQDSPVNSQGKFVQPPQLVWLAMNVLMTLIRPDAMTALLQHEWPGLVSVLLQECGAAGGHGWMVMGCLRTLLQCLGAQVGYYNYSYTEHFIDGQDDRVTDNMDNSKSTFCPRCLYTHMSLWQYSV